MAIKLKLLLPDNWDSTFLRGDFIERGNTYSTLQSRRKQDNGIGGLPDADKNRHTLVFGFELVDSETRLSATLGKITSLKISNDPAMQTASTIEISDWPSAGYNPAYSYTIQLNPAYFFDPVNNTPIFASSVNTSPSAEDAGLFFVENWPLSATGGLSTVYFQVIATAAGSGESCTYPENFGIYDQILWEPERPSTPGAPDIDSPVANLTGRKTTWRFRASEEASSGLFGTGVSRYCGDILELRQPIVSSVASNNRARSMFPLSSSVLTTNIRYGWDGTNTSGGTSYTPGNPLNLTTSTVGQMFFNVDGINTDVNGVNPDFNMQGVVYVNNNGILTSSFTIYAFLMDDDPSEFATNSCIGVSLYVGTSGCPVATLYRTVSNVITPSTVQTTNLPEYAREAIIAANGGEIEILVSRRSSYADRFIVEAYFTPFNSEESFIIARSYVPSFAVTTAWGGCGVLTQGLVGSQQTTVIIDEIALGAGRFLLDCDLGDCQTDGLTTTNSLSASVVMTSESSLVWAEALATQAMLGFVYKGDSGTRTGPSILATDIAPAGVRLTTVRSPLVRDYAEVQAAAPSFSDRYSIDWTANHTQGELYVVCSTYANRYGEPPMGYRIDPSYGEAYSPAIATLGVGFDAYQGKIRVYVRDEGGKLSVRDWLSYEPSSSTSDHLTWTLTVSHTENTTSQGTALTLQYNNAVVGQLLLETQLLSRAPGVGQYVGIGVRSCRAGLGGDDNAVLNGTATLRKFTVQGLPPISLTGDDDAVNERHFVKATGYSTGLKPFLGQRLINGNTDAGDFCLTNPLATEWPANSITTRWCNLVDLATTGSNLPGIVSGVLPIASAPTTLDGVTIRANHRILVKDQINQADNGLYQVTSNAGAPDDWIRLTELDNYLAPYMYVKVSDNSQVDLASTANITTSTSLASGILNHGPNVVDGVNVQVGNRVLVKNQSTIESNGIYYVETVGTGSNGVWARAGDLNQSSQVTDTLVVRVNGGNTQANMAYQLTPSSAPFTLGVSGNTLTFNLISNYGPINEGTKWYTAPFYGNVNIGVTPIAWKPAFYGFTLSTNAFDTFMTTVSPTLLEVLMRTREPNFKPRELPRVRIYQFSDDNSDITPLTPWISGPRIINQFFSWSTEPAPFDNLLQFNITDFTYTVGDNRYLFIIDTPGNCELAVANHSNMGEIVQLANGRTTGWNIADSMFYKLFGTHSPRFNNSFDSAWLQGRCVADSHARFLSNASILGSSALVGLTQPMYSTYGRPLITLTSTPTVRTACIQIEASSPVQVGLLAFRVGVQDDLNHTEFTHWLPWSDYVSYQELAPCAAMLTDNAVPLTGTPTVDGVALQVNDRVLVNTNGDLTLNGVYMVNSGAWTRTTDLSTDNQLINSIRLLVEGGTVYANTEQYIVLGPPQDLPPYYIVGTTTIQFTSSPTGGACRYTAFFYGQNPYLSNQSEDPTIPLRNAGFGGGRKIWAQVCDVVGNIAEADPLLVFAPSTILVDTVPPTGSMTFVDPSTGSPVAYQTKSKAWGLLNGQDNLSGIKDFRTRLIGAGHAEYWSQWKPYSEYVPMSINRTVPPTVGTVQDGFKRLEVQFRDFGNNSTQPSQLWDIIKSFDPQSLIFSLQAWQSVNSTSPTLYLMGTSFGEFDNYTLQDSLDPSYGSNKAFFVNSQATGTSGRRIYVREEDNVRVFVNSAEWTRFYPQPGDTDAIAPNNTFRIDDARGLIVFCQRPPYSATLVATIKRYTPIILSWDGNLIRTVANVANLGSKSITCSVSIPQGIVMGTDNGSIWFYDGAVVNSLTFSTTNNGVPLPITSLTVQQFEFETQPYIYVTTAIVPRCWRIAVGGLLTDSWEVVGSELSQFNVASGDFTCTTSGYEYLFIGTSYGQVIRYRRTPGTVSDNESCLQSNLSSSHMTPMEPNAMPVSCLLLSGDQVFAGIANKPEVHSFSRKINFMPAQEEVWTRKDFSRLFMNDPTPWQFYTTSVLNDVSPSNFDGNTLSRVNTDIVDANAGFLSVQQISSPTSESGFVDLMVLSGIASNITMFQCDVGSDWEQAISLKNTYTLEFSTMVLDNNPSSRQGIQISDGRYSFRVMLTPTSVELESGGVSISQPFGSVVSGFQAQSADSMSGPAYPESGVNVMWNFAENYEDRGPYWTGDPNTAITPSTQGWMASYHTVPGDSTGAAGVVSTISVDMASFTRNASIMTVTSAGNRDVSPTIYNNLTQPCMVSPKTRVLVRARINNPSTLDLNDATIQLGWSPLPFNTYEKPTHLTSLPLEQSEGFHTYEFQPSWSGAIQSLVIRIDGVQLQFDGSYYSLTSDDQGTFTIDFDYIVIANNLSTYNIRDNVVPIRIGVSDRDVQVWVGKQLAPLVDAPGFLNLPTTTSSIRFGKLDLEDPHSVWGWEYIKFKTNDVIAPISITEKDFALSWRFPSTGSVRALLHHDGTPWALTDGIISRKVSDNPDDRAMKAFSYNLENQVWVQEQPAPIRIQNGYGAIRPLAAVDFNQTLIISAQRGLINFQSPTLQSGFVNIIPINQGAQLTIQGTSTASGTLSGAGALVGSATGSSTSIITN
jgi:hypothetical protein